MLPDPRFLRQPKHFWANVRTISQQVGYTVRGKGVVKAPSIEQIRGAYTKLNLSTDHLFTGDGTPTKLGNTLLQYFAFRAQVLNDFVEPRLMDADRARTEFQKLKRRLKPTCPLPMNKQKKNKKAPAFFTCIINMIIEANTKGLPCDYDPQKLTTITKHNAPLRTLARRVDGTFPHVINPIAIWEIKEYYHSKTFGSRVADGVYETLLDGMELEELASQEKINVEHLLMVDAHHTWWVKGKPYLCRIIDMLHMGYVNEVLFGFEVIERLPAIVQNWVSTQQNRIQQKR